MFKKVIVSPLGEVTRDTRTSGDIIKYKIYHPNLHLEETKLTIRDKLDKNLSDIVVFNGGKYNSTRRTIKWVLKGESVRREGFVEFQAKIGKCEKIINQAVMEDERNRQPIKSNQVVTRVLPPPQLGWIPLMDDAKKGEPPRVNMKDETTMATTIRFDIPGLFVYNEKVDGITYQHISITGRASSTDVGKPELPVIGETIEVPFDVQFTPQIIKKKTIKIEGYTIYPAQPSPIAQPTKPEPFSIDATTYIKNDNYPSILVADPNQDVGVIRGHRVLLLKINPIQYNPVTKSVTVHHMIEVRLNYNHPAQLRGIDPRLASPAFEDMLKQTVLNYKEPDRFATAAGNGGNPEKNGCDYLIITADTLYNENDSNDSIIKLRNWKQSKGYITRIVKISSITNGNTAAGIRTYIKNTYDNWNPAPSYILLVGDSNLVSSNLGHDHPDEVKYNQPPIDTDLHYSKVDGTDYFPDIFIGRLSVDDQLQLTDVIDKILAYEKTPPATPANNAFYTDVSLIALCQDTTDTKPIPTGQESFPWIATMESIREYLLNQNYNVERIYSTNSGFPPAGPNSPPPTTYQDGTGMLNDLLSPQYGWDGDDQDITVALNNGRFLISCLVHGSPTSWANPNFGIGNINGSGNIPALNQNNLTPVVFSITCQTGWFDNEIDIDSRGGLPANSDSFAEALLRRPQGGAVAVIAQTRVSYIYWNSFIEIGLFKAIWPDFTPSPHWSGYPTVPTVSTPRLLRMGQILNFSKMFMAKSYSPSYKREIQFEMGHLFGDPEMPIWTNAPGKLDVDHPNGIGSTGQQSFVVRVTDEATSQALLNATVVLTRDNKVLQVQQTNNSGLARFDLNSIGSGDIDITVTLLDYRPYMDTIAVSSGGAVLDPLNPPDGVENQTIHIGGQGFKSNDKIDIYFGDNLLTTVDASNNGDFGQGGSPVDIKAPIGYGHGLVNVSARNKTSDRFAVRIFQLRDKNPVDLWTYDQWDSSTWTPYSGDHPTWNSPDIQLYDKNTGNEVASDNLQLQTPYIVKVKVHNKEGFSAKQTTVSYKWRNFGTGGLWELFTPNPVATIDVPAKPPGEATAQNEFAPPTTGHLCIQAEIEHLEDIKNTNNKGQENLTVGYTNSPKRFCFYVCNLTNVPGPVHLEVRQLIKPNQENEERLWATLVKHPDPQILQPGNRAKACVIVDPDPADVKPDTQAEFAVTAFIGGVMVGGVNLIVTKK